MSPALPAFLSRDGSMSSLAQEDSPSGASRMSGMEKGGGLSEEEDEALAVV